MESSVFSLSPFPLFYPSSSVFEGFLFFVDSSLKIGSICSFRLPVHRIDYCPWCGDFDLILESKTWGSAWSLARYEF